MNVGGIDLAAKERNTTGLCILGEELLCMSVKKDEEIIETLFAHKPSVVAIDAPLTEGEPFRDGEKALIRRGFRPLPTSMESMRALRERAGRLVEVFRSAGIVVIETFPAAFRTQLLDVKSVRKALGISNRHERDALLCALVARAYLEGKAERLGRNAPIYVVDRTYVEEKIKEMLGAKSASQRNVHRVGNRTV